jgi:hypothetical protein
VTSAGVRLVTYHPKKTALVAVFSFVAARIPGPGFTASRAHVLHLSSAQVLRPVPGRTRRLERSQQPEVSMRIACTSTPEGSVYRFYRTDLDVTVVLKPIVPLLLAGDVDVIVGPEDGDPGLLLRVGPIVGNAEAMLLDLVGRFVVAAPVSEPLARATTSPA